MKVIYKPRQTGKTTELIENWLKKDKKRALITFDGEEEKRLKRLFPDLINQIFSWDTYIKKMWRYDIKEVVIDNADMILQSYVNIPIRIVSITEED